MEEKLLWRAYKKSPTFIRTVQPPTPYGLLFPNIMGSQPPHETTIAIISGTGKATDFKFGQCIHRVHLNKSSLKFRRKGIVGVSRDCPLVPPIISGTGKATNFKFCTHIHRLNRNKSPLTLSWKVAVGVVKDSQKFQGTHIQGASRGHLAIYQLSYFYLRPISAKTICC